MKRACAAAGVILAAAVFAAALTPVGSPAASGVWNASERGCYCHQQDANPAVGFSVSGFPGRYVAGENYTIVISVTFTDVPAVANKSQGGFYIEASAGTFLVPTAMEGLVQVQGAQATHTQNGSMRRDWTVVWKAPDAAGLSVTFSLFVNTVNGNRSESLGSDHWTSKTVQIGVGDNPIVTGAPAPRPPFALETYGMLLFATLAAAYAFYVFRSARRPVGKDTPDHRQTRAKGARKKP